MLSTKIRDESTKALSHRCGFAKFTHNEKLLYSEGWNQAVRDLDQVIRNHEDYIMQLEGFALASMPESMLDAIKKEYNV